MPKILIYPLLRKTDYTVNTEKSQPSDEDLSKLTDFYMTEIIRNLKNHGFQLNTALLKDMSVTSDFLKSAMCRNVGKYHHLQDTVDQLEINTQEQKPGKE